VAVERELRRWDALFAARTRGGAGEGLLQILALAGAEDVISFAGGFPDPSTFPGTAVAEILRELDEYLGNRPATTEEIAKIRNRDVRALSGRYETNAAVGGAIAEMVTFGWPDDYVRTLKERIEAQTDDGVRAAAKQVLDSSRVTWVVIGDLAKIEQPVRDLKLGEVQVLDADGNVLR